MTPSLHPLHPRLPARVLKLAGAIADLAGAEQIAAPHIAKALQERPRVEVG